MFHTVDYLLTYTKADGTSGTVRATQSIVKQKAGAIGTRGSRSIYDTNAKYISGYSGYAADAATLIAAATSGLNPTTPIKGDEVTFTNGTSYTYTLSYNGSAWVEPGVVIDGNLLVTGSISATKLAATNGWKLRSDLGPPPVR